MDVPENWPTHFEEALHYLNEQILLLLKYLPKELLLGLVINTWPTPLAASSAPVMEADISLQSAYRRQQWDNGYSQIVENAHCQKEAFDKKLLGRAPREVVFKMGELVQIYRSNLNYTMKATRKLEPRWSAPRCVISRNKNSYKLKTLEGLPIRGHFSPRQLCRFIPRDGTSLAAAQRAVEEAMGLVDKAADKKIEVAVSMRRNAAAVDSGIDSSVDRSINSEDGSREESGAGESDDENARENKEETGGEEETNSNGSRENSDQGDSEQDENMPKERIIPQRSKRLAAKFFSMGVR